MNSAVASVAPLTVAEVTQLLSEHFPQLSDSGKAFEIIDVNALGSSVRLLHREANLRPGGTISGPAMFTLADVAAYVAIISRMGPTGLQAVTANITLNFLARPPAGAMIADCRILRMGRRTAVSEIKLLAEDTQALVAHVTATYALPPA